jgi:xanthine dehydrogenase YagT iron-sulfur-binding subunit
VPDPPGAVPLELHVNGDPVAVVVDPRTTLLDLLREHLDLTGAKKGCDHGQCGSCTVLVEGRRINSCLTFAVAHAGDHVRTVEGLAGDHDGLHPLPRAFLEHDAFQCGYCTPGQLCSAVGMLDEVAAGWPSAVTPPLAGKGPAVHLDENELKERMSGNLCRCGAYVHLVRAIADAAR